MEKEQIIIKVKARLAKSKLDPAAESKLEKAVGLALNKVMPKLEDEFTKKGSMDVVVSLATEVFNNVLPVIKTMTGSEPATIAQSILGMCLANQMWRGMLGRSDLNGNQGSRTFLTHMTDLVKAVLH